MALFLDIFRSYLEELLLIKLSFTYKILLQNIKRSVRYLGSNLSQNEKTRKVGYLSRLGYPSLQ